MDAQSLEGFNQTRYQGEWYMVADTEPSELPSCHCDRFTWTLNPEKAEEFESKQQTTCTILGKEVPVLMPFSGELSQDPAYPGFRTEGAPPFAARIPNMVLYIDRDSMMQEKTGYEYSTVLVYSCMENYLFHRVYESVQVLSRIPNLSNSTIDHFLQKAKELGLVINERILKKRQNFECNYPRSLLPPKFIKS